MPDATPIVFVVDDDVSVRESLELLIRCAGWQPETFASAQEFLARPRVRAPSCLVLDVSLPGLNGLDLQKRVAAERTDMPIIFITGHGDVPMTVQAMKAGAAEFLPKPFRDDALVSAIRNALERSHAALSREAQTRVPRGGGEGGRGLGGGGGGGGPPWGPGGPGGPKGGPIRGSRRPGGGRALRAVRPHGEAGGGEGGVVPAATDTVNRTQVHSVGR